MSARYTINSPAAGISVVGGVPISVLGFLNGDSVFRIIELGLSFDGIDSTNRPVLVELFSWDDTTGAGALSLFQSGGSPRPQQGAGTTEFTTEPTVLTRVKAWRIRPDGGLVILQSPLGREVEQFRNAEGYVIRCSADDTVLFDGYMEVEEG